MKTDFQIKAIPCSEVSYLFSLDDEELSRIGALRRVADRPTGYPCRITLEDAPQGEEVILFTYEHHNVASAYRASGPVYVRKSLETARPGTNEIPAMLQHRFLSLRAYDTHAMMLRSGTVKGDVLQQELKNILRDPSVEYIHIHNAGPGCYVCQANRI